MHENDRSATGFLPPAEFEHVANAFFAQPEASIRGWERAIDAQTRIRREVDIVLARALEGDVLFVGHGGVGNAPVVQPDAWRNQPCPRSGWRSGNYFTFTRAHRSVVHCWRRMENPPMPGDARSNA
jgi:hypothetical protein